jgi:hypothetical protein
MSSEWSKVSQEIAMYSCYLDESGTPEPGGTSHFVLVGFAIPSAQWKQLENQISGIKAGYGLRDEEIHTTWMTRRYLEHEAIRGFDHLGHDDRRQQAQTLRDKHFLPVAATGNNKQLKAAKLNYRKTSPYTHLTRIERLEVLRKLADCLGNWSEARFFAEVVDKHHVTSLPPQSNPPFEYAFTGWYSALSASS